MKPQISVPPVKCRSFSTATQPPSSQWEERYWTVLSGITPSPAMGPQPWDTPETHSFFQPVPVLFLSFSQASSLEADLELDSQINSN